MSAPLDFVSLGTAPLGEWVHLRATLHGDPLLTSPLSDAPCVHYEVLVTMWNEAAGGFRPVVEERVWSRRVVLRDGRAEALLDPEQACVFLRVSELCEIPRAQTAPAAIRGLLATHRVLSRERLKYREVKLEEGAEVFLRTRLARTERGLVLLGDDDEKPTLAVDEAMLRPV